MKLLLFLANLSVLRWKITFKVIEQVSVHLIYKLKAMNWLSEAKNTQISLISLFQKPSFSLKSFPFAPSLMQNQNHKGPFGPFSSQLTTVEILYYPSKFNTLMWNI